MVAIDADINQHLAWARPRRTAAAIPLGAQLTEIKEFLRGDNPRISSAQAMVKTTPPGRGPGCCAGDDDPSSSAVATPWAACG